MAGLADIRDNPNYVNANAATKRAIFEKYSANDPAYTNANLATQSAIRKRFGLEEAAPVEAAPAQTEIPAQRKQPLTMPRFTGVGGDVGPAMAMLTPEQKTEALRTGVTGAIGLAAGPALGAVVRGAGATFPAIQPFATPFATSLEYGGFRSGLGPTSTRLQRTGMRVLGGATTGGVSGGVVEPQDFATSAAVGATLPVVLPPLTRPLARTAGYVIDALQGKVGDARANRLVRETVGDQLNAMRQVMAMYPDELPSRIVANMNTKGDLDALQTLLATAEQSDRAKTIKALRQTEKEDVINALTRIAGGATSEEARAARETAKGALTNVTTPLREEAFAAARRTGEVMPKLETIATEARAEAKTNVDKVRRFSEAVNKADDWAKNWVTDSRLVQQPDGTFTREYVTNQGVGEAGVRLPAQAEQRYTYPGQLAAGGRESTVGGPFERQVIDEGGVIAKRIREAAETSVQAGARARAAENTLQSMKDRGLQPIESAKLTASINGLLGSPEVATNREASRAIPRVVEMINDWTNQNGVVTPEALYAIRKNAVAGVIRELNPTMDAKAQERFAAQVMSSIKPVFDTAIEKAGGKAFKDYLLSFERGMSDIKGMELADKIRKLYADGTPAAKQQIVDLVKGESPDVVEELFGSGRYKIGKEMSKDMKLLQQIANNAGLDLAALEQAKSGVKPLTAIMESQSYKLRFPFFTRVSTGFNEALAALEKKTKRETMDKIIKAAQSGKDFNELLDAIPAKERSAFLEQFKNADSWGKFTGNVAQAMSAQTTATPRNKLAPTSQNALAQ